MLRWLKNRLPPAYPDNTPDADVTASEQPIAIGKYVSLYKYLNGRYANGLVLTFAEIEDLLGFSLPIAARLNEEWWTNPDSTTTQPRFSDCWLLASRTARPNLQALTVAFDRIT
jgi:hypothetical protein